MQNLAQTSLRRTRFAALVTSVTAAAFAALPQMASAGVAAPDSGASPTADSINILYLIVAVIGILALIAVVVSIFSAVRSPAIGGPDDSSASLAVVGSVAMVLALAILGGLTLSGSSTADQSASGTPATYKLTPLEDPGLKTGHIVEAPQGPAIGVHVNGQQFLWRYTYLGKGVYSYHDLVVPVGVTVMLYVTSSDVQHNWWVPRLGASIQAVPGYLNTGWIRADKAGTFRGASTVISGTNYQNMSTRVIALPADEFDAWLKQKGEELKLSATGLAAQKAAAAKAAEGAAK